MLALWERARAGQEKSSIRESRRLKLAESFGVAASRVTSPDHLRPALEKALAHGGPTLVVVKVPRDSETTPWTFIHPAKP